MSLYYLLFIKLKNHWLIKLFSQRYILCIVSKFWFWMKTRIVSTHSFALLFAKKHDKLLIHNNRRQERIHVSVARSSRLASYSAADPRNDFSVCRADTRTESHTVGRRSDCTTLRRALSSLHLIPNKLSFILSAYRARLRESVKVQPWPV